MAICNKDCLHCPYPDCINDDLDYEDYKAAAELEREIILPRTAKQRKVATYQKAYREANREKVAARKKAYYEANREKVATYQKAYREANREKVATYQKAYREANREKVATYQKAYYEANREKVAAQQKIRDRRLAEGYTQRDLARLIGVTQPTVARWETCVVPADWDKLRSIFPDI